MWQFSFILGLFFIFLCFILIVIHYIYHIQCTKTKEKEHGTVDKIEPVQQIYLQLYSAVV